MTELEVLDIKTANDRIPTYKRITIDLEYSDATHLIHLAHEYLSKCRMMNSKTDIIIDLPVFKNQKAIIPCVYSNTDTEVYYPRCQFYMEQWVVRFLTKREIIYDILPMSEYQKLIS